MVNFKKAIENIRIYDKIIIGAKIVKAPISIKEITVPQTGGTVQIHIHKDIGIKPIRRQYIWILLKMH